MVFESSVSQIRSAYAAQDRAKQALLATSGVFANKPERIAVGRDAVGRLVSRFVHVV